MSTAIQHVAVATAQYDGHDSIHMFPSLFDVPSLGADAPDDFPMIEDGEVHGDFPSDPDELIIYLHGWLDMVTGAAEDQANAVRGAVDVAGYDADVVGFSYPSNLPLWQPTKHLSTRKGRELAGWLRDYTADHPDATIRLVSHSLGARPALACLDVLADHGAAVESLSLLGAGIGCDAVAEGGRYYDAVRDGAGAVHNYYLNWEFTLDFLYRPAEFGDRALGVRGVCGHPPDNYTDHNVSDTVTGHFSYLKEDGGCLDRVIADFHADSVPAGE